MDGIFGIENETKDGVLASRRDNIRARVETRLWKLLVL